MSTLTAASDSRFAEAEAEVDRGEPWRFREQDAPNPLTIEALEWSKGQTKFGEAEFLTGVDQSGKRWSVLVGGVVLTKRLIEGTIEGWDDATESFVVTRTLGRVQPGEVVSIKYSGDREGPQGPYPNFNVARKPATGVVGGAIDENDEAGDDVPF
jgi:hypothetical protein